MLSSISRASLRRVVQGSQPLTRRGCQGISHPQRSNDVCYPLFTAARYYITSTRNPASDAHAPAVRQRAPARQASTQARKQNTVAKSPKKAAAKRTATTKAKAKAKPKPKKKVLTEAQKLKAKKSKDAAEKKTLRASALTPPKPSPTSAWAVYITDHIKDKLTTMSFNLAMTEIAAGYKALSSQEREQYESVAQQNRAKNESEYQTWLETHRPEQIYLANKARKLLNKKSEAANPDKQSGPKYALLQDSRLPKRPSNAYSLFVASRWGSGDFKGTSVPEAGRLISKQWRELSPDERKVFEDDAAAEHSRYEQAYSSAIGREVSQ